MKQKQMAEIKFVFNKILKVETLTTQTSIHMPNFLSIDTKIGLSHMAEDDKLYLKILHDFYNHYKNFNLDQLDDETFIREIHTINSLSANIGAKSLHTISKALDSTHNKMLLPHFYKTLHQVIDELKIVEDLLDNQIASEQLQNVTQLQKDELFTKLKNALEDELPKNCYDTIKTLEHYKLSSVDAQTIQQVQECLDTFDFENAFKLL